MIKNIGNNEHDLLIQEKHEGELNNQKKLSSLQSESDSLDSDS